MNLIKKFFFKKADAGHVNISELEERIKEIRKNSDVIAICPDNTGYSWLGVKRGALALFDDKLLVLPQYYSESRLSVKELSEICDLIINQEFQKIVLRGFPPYFEFLIKYLKEKKQNLPVYFLYAGFLAENSSNLAAKENFVRIIELIRTGLINKVGFNKPGLAETVKNLYGIDAFEYLNKTYIYPPELLEKQSLPNGFNIGVLGNNDFRKNIHNQVAAALMVKNSYVHVRELDPVQYLDTTKRRIIEHNGELSHQAYVSLLAGMDLNMYVSFSESWGHVITESLSVGIPCLVSKTSSIFDYDDELADLLIVKDIDNSVAITAQIKRILHRKDEIGRRGREYVLKLNRIADERINEWLDD